MSWAQSDLDNLEKAIAEGALTVQYKDKMITYRSLKDMLSLREIMKREINGESNFKKIQPYYDKGLN